MIKAIICACGLFVICSGWGSFMRKYLKTEQDGLRAPFGAAVLFALLEILYAPALVLNLSMTWIDVCTIAALLAGAAFFLKDAGELIRQLKGPYFWITVLSGILFTILFVRFGGHMPAVQDSYLTAIIENVRAPSLHLGQYNMQGYVPLVSCLAGLLGSVPEALLAMGLFANLIAAALTLNILKSFSLRNPWLRFVLIFACVFYMNFYSWKIVSAWGQDNWRVLFTAMNLYTAYTWLKSKQEAKQYEMLCVTTAGLFCSNGYTLLAFELLYALGVWFLLNKRVRILYDLITLIAPVIFYGCAWMGKWAPGRAWLIALLYIAILLGRNLKSGYRILINIENYLIDHARTIFLIAIPAVFLVGTLILRFFTHLAVPYSEYIKFLRGTTIRPYLALESNALDVIMDVFRWGGLLWMLHKPKTDENRMIRIVFLCTVTFFLNPLCMGMFTNITGPEVYANAFEILFNPFTDILIFVTIYYVFEWKVIGQWILELSLCAVVLLGHAGSFLKQPYGLYTDLVENASAEVQP